MSPCAAEVAAMELEPEDKTAHDDPAPENEDPTKEYHDDEHGT